VNFDPILLHSVRLFYSINVFKQSRLSHLCDLPPGDYSAFPFIKWLAHSSNVTVVALDDAINSFPGDHIASSSLDNYFTEALTNLYSHTLSEVIDSPAHTESITISPDNRTSSKPTVIFNSTTDILYLKSNKPSLLPISSHPSVGDLDSLSEYSTSIFLPPGFSAEYFGTIDITSFTFTENTDIESFDIVFTSTLSKLAELLIIHYRF